MCSCRLCYREVKSLLGFPPHLRRIHGIGTQEYFDKFFRSGSDGLCVICGGLTKFINLQYGYREFCSHECADSSEIVRERRSLTTFDRYGVFNVFQHPEKREKIKQTLIERYGVDHPMHSAEVLTRMKATNQERYGCDWQIASSGTREKIEETFQKRYGGNPFGDAVVQKKIEETNIERYGAAHPVNFWVEQVHGVSCALRMPGKLEQVRQTNREKYGVDWVSQDTEIHVRQMTSAFKIRNVLIEGRVFSCQGYEEQFLRRCSEFGMELRDISDDVPSIPYQDAGSKWHRYIPDFIHTPTGTVIEVKSTWTFDGNGEKLTWKDNNRRKLAAAEFFLLAVFDSRGNHFSATTLDEFDNLFKK